MKLTKIAKNLNKAIQEHKSFCIMPHMMADGDAVGSAIALSNYIIQQNRQCCILMEEPVPYIYSFMEHTADILLYSADNEYNFDVYIAIDTGDLGRLGRRNNLFKSNLSFNIDHHKTNDGYGDFNFVDASYSSTGEILYDLLHILNADFNHEIAQALYVAISTDTGGFRYQNTTKKCFEIAANLMDYDIDIEKISNWVFEITNLKRLNLQKNTISNIQLHCGGKVASSILKKEDFLNISTKDEDFEGLVDIVRSIEGVEVGLFLRERIGKDKVSVKGSLRSNSDKVDVSIIAQNNDGGGHARAAGIATSKDIDKVYQNIIKELKEIFKCKE